MLTRTSRGLRRREEGALGCHFEGWEVNLIGCVREGERVLVLQGRGIYILYEDVKSCPCEDVHVLWSILVESHPPPLPWKQ
ncbi:hypothetical protein CDL15_Pgr008571 [Punica granatum]|uniref:Uncharacterized protein n=1 Tax=Punica granatum TaxID=22663 RepID=A0A218WN19_PUNGR|nr:hypothetical protein CDL15_Pgr008571 [Punica granatum]